MRTIAWGKGCLDKVIRLDLRQSGDTVHLVAVDANGVPILGGLVAVVDSTGLRRIPMAAFWVGLPLDSENRVLLNE